MITDTIKNRNLYAAISPRIKTALDYLADTDFSRVEPGRYEIDGQNLYVMVQQYDTIPKEQAKWECHRNYIDIQFIVEGVEQIGFSNVENMKILVEYDPVKDIEILTGDGDYVTLDRGSFGIFFPQDAHQPKVAPDNISGKVKKVVAKVKIK